MTRIAVLGAGMVGSAYAVLLARAGHDLAMVARGRRRRSLDAGFLRLRRGGEPLVAPRTTVERLSEAPARSDPDDGRRFGVASRPRARWSSAGTPGRPDWPTGRGTPGR